MKTKQNSLDLLEKFFNDDSQENKAIIEKYNNKSHSGVEIDEYFEKMNLTFHDFYDNLFESKFTDWKTADLFPDNFLINSVSVSPYNVGSGNEELTDVSYNSNDLTCAA